MNISGYHIAIGNATDVGKIRERNEDYMAHFNTPLGYCIIVCDGMGGHVAGQVASQNAVEAIRQYLQDNNNKNAAISVALKNAIEFANFQLREMVNQDPALKGMGTTCVMGLINDGQFYIAHAGDSRLYLIRNGTAEQITKDHSSVQKLIDLGVLTEKEAELSDKKNQISKAIGVFEKVDPSVTENPVVLQKNDKLLLCSDGLTGHVNREQILETVSSVDDVQEAALKLIEMANTGGGTDNITVQLVHYSGNTITTKTKGLTIKKIEALFFLFAALALGFMGYMKFSNNRNHQPDSNKTDTIKHNAGTLTEEEKTDLKKENETGKPDTTAPKNQNVPLYKYDSLLKKWIIIEPG